MDSLYSDIVIFESEPADFGSAFGEDRGVVTLVACRDGAGWGWLYAYRQAR